MYHLIKILIHMRKIGRVMDDKNLLDKIISLTEEIVKLKIENAKLKEELKHERELNKFRAEFPNKI